MLEVISMLLAAIAAAGSIPNNSRGTTPAPPMSPQIANIHKSIYDAINFAQEATMGNH